MADADYQWGKMSRGQPYILLAVDMFRAFFALGLGEVEGLILAHVIENTWGLTAKRGRKGRAWPPTRPCAINLSALAISLNAPYQRVQEARSRLLRSGIIVMVDGGYLVNKEAHTWTRPTGLGPRISAPILAHAASAQKLNPPALAPPENTVDRVFPADASTSGNTLDRVSPGEKNTVDRVFSKHKNTVDRVSSTIVDTVDRVFPLEDRTRGNPTGSNTNSTRSRPNAARPSGGVHKKPRKQGRTRAHLLPLKDVDAFPVELSPADAPLHSHVLGLTRTRDLPEGNPDIADHVVREFRSWVERGWSVAVVKKSINEAIKKGTVRDVGRFSGYLAGIFARLAKERAELPDAPPQLKPSQTNPVAYFKAPTLPPAQAEGLEGSR